MKILLIRPASNFFGPSFTHLANTEPLALELIAATVPDHEIRIYDMRNDSDLQRQLNTFSPEMVGVTALTTEVYAAQKVLANVKEFSPDIFTVVGGHHATLIPEDFTIPQVDAIALGEGEFVFPYLVDAISNGRKLEGVQGLIWQDSEGRFIRNTMPKMTSTMDDLKLPRRDLISSYRDNYFFLAHRPDTSMATSRGCPYRCNFCSVWEFYNGNTQQMSPKRVLEEIKSIDTSTITFVDDNFMLNYKREEAIADLIRSEGIQKKYFVECRTDSIVRHPELLAKWSKIGLQGVFFGLEGASDKTLKSLNKKNQSNINEEAIQICRDNGVAIWGSFIVDPDWNADDFEHLHDYVDEKEIAMNQFCVLTPLPGTPLYRDKFDELLTHDYTFFDCLHSVLKPDCLASSFMNVTRHCTDHVTFPDSQEFFAVVR